MSFYTCYCVVMIHVGSKHSFCSSNQQPVSIQLFSYLESVASVLAAPGEVILVHLRQVLDLIIKHEVYSMTEESHKEHITKVMKQLLAVKER